MELKMFNCGEDTGCTYWICAENQEQAERIYKSTFGEEVFNEMVEFCGDEAIKEEPNDKMWTYYDDGVTPEKDTFGNIIKKYCTKPDVFACSQF